MTKRPPRTHKSDRKAAGWPALVLEFKGVPGTPPFESFRRGLRTRRTRWKVTKLASDR
jgi:hypothetical protein